jgi:hypothetical protein
MAIVYKYDADNRKFIMSDNDTGQIIAESPVFANGNEAFKFDRIWDAITRAAHKEAIKIIKELDFYNIDVNEDYLKAYNAAKTAITKAEGK